MRRWLPVGLLVLCTGSWALAGVNERAVSELRADYPEVLVRTESERPTRVFGSVFGVGETPELVAQDFVLNHSDVFGLTADELVPGNTFNGLYTQPVMPDRQNGGYKFTLVYYHQERDGVPVYGSDLRLLVRNDAGYPLVLAASSLRELGTFSVPRGIAATMDENKALDAALAQVPSLTNFSASELVVWAGLNGERAEPHTAVTFVADNYATQPFKPERWRFVADAATGEILHAESLIRFADIMGNVSGKATEGAKADICSPEVPTAMPWARVRIPSTGAEVYADQDGNFTIPFAGGLQATLQSYMDGLYFTVDNYAGDEDTLPLTVAPPGPAFFMHNADNDDDLIRSQVNCYVAANQVRDWVLAGHPGYPSISVETGFPIYVNRTDFYCPCNAWSDGLSINFCQADDGCPNTGWQSVLNHEYGHHAVDAGGSGQGAYGEGMSDCFSMLPVDSPYLAYGFFGDCDSGLRSADNDYQYPCTGEIHDCGQLLSGCVWSTRQEMVAAGVEDYLQVLGDLAVNSIMLHSGTEITPSITIDFLTLDDTDGDIYNGTPHALQICAGFGAHNMDCPPIEFSPIGFEYPEGRPEMATPGQVTSFPVEVVALTAAPVSGTGQFHYRVSGGAWVTVTMPEGAANEYTATLPAATCDDNFEWYVSAEATGEGVVTHPSDAPAHAFYTVVATGIEVVFADDFETDKGWTVYAGADTGNWERADPQEVTSGWWDPVITQPADDHSAIGTKCYVTGAAAGSSAGDYDVDGGPSHLTSPVMDLSGNDATVSYWRWYHISTELDDDLVVAVTNNGGASWTTVESISDRQTWTYVEWKVSDYVTPTAQVQVRFTVNDTSPGSLMEALVDDFSVSGYVCDGPVLCPGDLSCNGTVGYEDIDLFVEALGFPGGAGWTHDCPWLNGDCTGDSDVTYADIDPFVARIGATCN